MADPRQVGRGRHRAPRRRREHLLRLAFGVLAGLCVVAAVLVMAVLPAAEPRRVLAGIVEAGDADFYAPPEPAAVAAPGTVVRSEPLLSAPDGAVAWRVLYHSTDQRGSDIVVSGVVAAPDGPGPADGRTVVGWGHPTTGAVARCAPSRGVAPFILIEGLLSLLHAGYVVAAPDYPGLGVAGASSYLIGASEGHSLLDAVRAARTLPTGAGTGADAPRPCCGVTPRAVTRCSSGRRRRAGTRRS